MSAETECICRWRKEYRNAIAAEFGLKAHWQYQCVLTGPRSTSGSNEGLTDHSTPDLYGAWPRSSCECHA
jgi:hypothetical protein